ncbi:MAG: hypothetical protein AB9844_00905 [Clostridiaceae bacterium]
MKFVPMGNSHFKTLYALMFHIGHMSIRSDIIDRFKRSGNPMRFNAKKYVFMLNKWTSNIIKIIA